MRTLTSAVFTLALLGAFSGGALAASPGHRESAVIRCKANLDGTLADCQLVSQEPKDGPTGQNALMMAKLIKLTPDAVDKAMRAGGFFTTRIVFKNDDQPTDGAVNPSAAGKAAKDEDWELLARLPDRWLFIQGERSRTKDLSRVVFVLSAYTTPRENLGHAVASSLDGDLFDCEHRIVKLGSRINFGENGQPVDEGNYGGVAEPSDEGAVGQLKTKIVCESFKPKGPTAPTQSLAVGLVKGMIAQVPPGELEKMVPTQHLAVFEPPPLKLTPPQPGSRQLPAGQAIDLASQSPPPPGP